jgi:hypothetical protein
MTQKLCYSVDFRAVLPDAYYQATEKLHLARYHSIVMPNRGKW